MNRKKYKSKSHFPRELKPCKNRNNKDNITDESSSNSSSSTSNSKSSFMGSFPGNMSCSMSMLDKIYKSEDTETSKNDAKSYQCQTKTSDTDTICSSDTGISKFKNCPARKQRFHSYDESSLSSSHYKNDKDKSIFSTEPQYRKELFKGEKSSIDTVMKEKNNLENRVVLLDKFNHFKIVSNQKQFCLYDACRPTMNHICFSLFENEYYSADDAQLTNHNGFLEIVSQPFCNTTPYNCEGATEDGYLDHYKFVAFSECAFPATCGKEIYYESRMSAMTCGTEQHPFPRDKHNVEDPFDDPRLATAGITMFDFESDILANVVFTNKSIYAVYGRLPSCRLKTRDGSAFLSMTKIGTRDVHNPLSDTQNVGIGYDKDRGLLRWYINGNEVYRVAQVGHRPPNAKNLLILDHGGRDETVCPKQFWVGFGTFTYLDAHKPNNLEGEDNNALVKIVSLPNYYFYPIRPNADTGAAIIDETFNDNSSLPGSRVWGQGATLRIEYIKVCYKSGKRYD